MGFRTLSQAGALSSGSEVWVFPGLSHSAWARRADWYLNFQITRAANHALPQISAELMDILKAEEIPLKSFPSWQKDPLMVITDGRLPTGQVIEVSFGGDFKSWLKKVYEVWQKLHVTSVRIFLPEGHESTQFQQHWPASTDAVDISLVVP
jgi:hypothetical protein